MSIETGLRFGIISGLRFDISSGLNPTDGFFNEEATNLAALITLQSNAVGPGLGVGQEAIETDISDPFAAVQITRYSANNIGPPPAWVAEGPEDLQPATAFVGVNFPIDHAGCELKLGRLLNVRDAGLWKIIIVAINGSGLEDEWCNPAYPSGGPSLMTQLLAQIDAQLVAMSARLELIVPLGGESDSGESPDHLNFDDNLQTLVIQRLRGRYGPAKVVVPRLHAHSTAGGSLHTVIANAYDFCNRNTGCAVVNTNNLTLQVDNVHYADAGLIGLGTLIDTAYGRLRAGTSPSNPYVVAHGIPSIGSSAQGTSPSMPVHTTNDVLVFIYSGNGNTNVGTPSGWTAMTDSPQHDGGAGGNARLNVWWLRATSGATTAPTTADVSGDGGKIGIVLVIRGCRTSGNPFVDTTGAVAASGTAVSFPTLDTTGSNNCLVLNILAATYNAATAAQGSAWANTDLTEVIQELDHFSTASSAGMIVVSGVKATAGAIGATTLTLANAATQALLSVAFTPA